MSCCRQPIVRVAVLAAVVAVSCSLTAQAAEPVRLTDDGRLKRDPRFVEGGSHVVYTVVEGPTIDRPVKLDLSSGKVAPLYPQTATSQFESSFSPDGRYHAFVEFRGVTNVKLVIRDTAEKRDAVFDPGSDRAHLGNPVIDPHRRRVVFSLPRTVGQQLVSVNFEGQDLQPLTTASEAIDDWAAVSPDGSRLAFGSSRDGDFEIYVMDADGTAAKRLTDSPGMDMRPSWSPDGRTLAFTSTRDGNYEIYTLDAADGSQVRRVTRHPERDDFPQWHPDGKRLLTVSERGGQFDLYLHDVAGP